MGYGTQEFMSKVRTTSFGNMSAWKKKGKTVGWIHPDGFRDRYSHNMIMAKKDSGEVYQKIPICAGQGCPLCLLVDFAKERAGAISEKEDLVVLCRAIKGKDKKQDDRVISYTLKELAGVGDWRRRMSATIEYLFPWIPRDDRNPESPIEVIQASTGLVQAIKRVIQGQIEDRGEKKGDPLVTPYAIKLVYHKDEIPARMYHAERVDADLAEIDDEVHDLLESSVTDHGIDFDKLLTPSSKKDLMEAIESMWDDDCALSFDDFVEFCNVAGSQFEEDSTPKSKRRLVKEELEEDSTLKSKRRLVKEELVDDATPKNRHRSSKEESDEMTDKEKQIENARNRRERMYGKTTSEPVRSQETATGNRLVKCPECGEKVVRGKYGKCPECAAVLEVVNDDEDVPF